MKKFMIFLLMAFLYIGTCQARSESSHPNDAQLKLLSWVSPTPSQSFMTRSVEGVAAVGLELTVSGSATINVGESASLVLCPNAEALALVAQVLGVATNPAATWAEIQENATLTWTINGSSDQHPEGLEYTINYEDGCVHATFVPTDPNDYVITATVSGSLTANSGYNVPFSYTSEPVTITVQPAEEDNDCSFTLSFTNNAAGSIYEGDELSETLNVYEGDESMCYVNVYPTTPSDQLTFIFLVNDNPAAWVRGNSESIIKSLSDIYSDFVADESYTITVIAAYDENADNEAQQCGDPQSVTVYIEDWDNPDDPDDPDEEPEYCENLQFLDETGAPVTSLTAPAGSTIHLTLSTTEDQVEQLLADLPYWQTNIEDNNIDTDGDSELEYMIPEETVPGDYAIWIDLCLQSVDITVTTPEEPAQCSLSDVTIENTATGESWTIMEQGDQQAPEIIVTTDDVANLKVTMSGNPSEMYSVSYGDALSTFGGEGLLSLMLFPNGLEAGNYLISFDALNANYVPCEVGGEFEITVVDNSTPVEPCELIVVKDENGDELINPAGEQTAELEVAPGDQIQLTVEFSAPYYYFLDWTLDDEQISYDQEMVMEGVENITLTLPTTLAEGEHVIAFSSDIYDNETYYVTCGKEITLTVTEGEEPFDPCQTVPVFDGTGNPVTEVTLHAGDGPITLSIGYEGLEITGWETDYPGGLEEDYDVATLPGPTATTTPGDYTVTVNFEMFGIFSQLDGGSFISFDEPVECHNTVILHVQGNEEPNPPTPTPDAGGLYVDIVGNTVVCPDDEVTLTATLIPANASFNRIIWTRGQNVIFDANEQPIVGPSITFVPSQLFGDSEDRTITVEVSYGDCNEPVTKTVEIRYLPEAPDIHIAISADTICVGGQITATIDTTGSEYPWNLNNPIYSWYVNGIEVPGEHMGEITLHMPMAGAYGFAAMINTPLCGVSVQSEPDTVHVFDALPLTITGDNVVCQNDTATMTATNITGATYAWAGPDPAAASVTGNVLSTTIPGVYAVTATMSEGCFATAEFTVYQFGGDLQVTADQMNVCPGTPVVLNANLDGWFNENISYEWSNGLGTSSTVSTTVDATTTYTVTAYAQSQGANENNSNNCSLTSSITINATPGDTVTTTLKAPFATDLCVGAENGFYVDQPLAESYIWYLDGVEIPGENLPKLLMSFFEAGQHSVQAKAVVSGCQVATLSNQNNFEVYHLPEITIYGNNVICSGNEAEIIANAYNNLTYPGLTYTYDYEWSNGTNNDTMTTTEAGVYTVTVTNQYDCQSTASIDVTTFGGDLQISASEMHVCPGTPVTLNANLDGWNNENITYTWGDGSTSSTISVTVDETTTYQVTASTVNAEACQLVSSITITAAANDTIITAAPEVDNQTVCVGGQIVLSVEDDSYEYIWYKNGVEIPGENQPTINVTPTHSGIYTFAAKAIVPECYTSLVSDPVSVTVDAAPIVNITGTQTTVVNGATSATLTASVLPQGDYSYTWSTGATDVTSISVNEAGVYNVTVTGANCTAVSMPFQVYPVSSIRVRLIAPRQICNTAPVIPITPEIEGDNFSDELRYRWLVNGQYMPGQDQLNFTMSPQQVYDLVQTTQIYPCLEISDPANCDNLIVQCTDEPIDITGMIIPHHVIVLNNNTEAGRVCEGAQLNLTVMVEGEDGEVYEDPDLNYVWTRNGVVIPGVHGSSFSEQAWIYDSDPVTYVYAAYIDYGNGCLSDTVASQEIYVRRNPIVTIDGNPNVCYEGVNDMNVSLVAWVDGYYDPTATYKWYESGQALDNDAGMMNYYVGHFDPNYLNPLIFTVEVTNGNGCSTIAEPFYVNVYDRPIVNISGDANTVCTNGSVTLRANLNNYNDTMLVFQWYENEYNSANLIPGATHEIETFHPTQATTYVVAVTHLMDYNNPDCVGVDSFRVSINGIPQVTVTNDLNGANEICEGRSITFNGHTTGGVDGEAVYTWYRNGERILNVEDSLYVDAPLAVDGYPTTYIYSVIVNQGISGCESELTYFDTITVNPNPAIQLVSDPIICSEDGNNVVLTANMDVVPTGVQYRWLEDNAEFLVTDTNSISLHKDFSENPYNFSVQIVNDYGCTGESAISVYVNDAPVVAITATDTMVCEGGQVTLAAALQDWNATGLTYQWFDGETAIEDATSLSYVVTPAFGEEHQYSIVINQTSSGCQATSRPITVNVVEKPAITSVAEVNMPADRNVCDGYQVNLTANVEGGIQGGEIFTWYRNGVEVEDATLATLSDVLTAVNGETTTYTYSVAVAQAISGCVSEVFVMDSIVVNPNPVLQLVTNPIVCNDEGDNITLTANLNPEMEGATFRWLEDNVEMDPETYTANGNAITLHKDYRYQPYSFSVELVSELGCTAVGEALVYVNEAPVVNIFASDTVLCDGGELTLTASLNDWNATDLVYEWYDGEELMEGITLLSNVLTPASGVHHYHARILQQSSGCVAESNVIDVTVNGAPVIESVGTPQTSICYGGQLSITASPEGGNQEGDTYTWYRNGILMEGATAATIYDTPEIIDNNTQQFVYTAILSRPAPGCTSDAVTSDVVTVYPNPVVVITGDQHVCETDSVFLIANVDTVGMNVGGLHYTWYESGQIRDNMAYNLGDNNFFAEYMYARTEPYRFTVDVWRDDMGAGCISHSEEYLVYVYTQPVVNITATETEICENGQVTLTANLNDYNATDLMYQWFTVGQEMNVLAVDYDEDGSIIYDTVYNEVFNNIPGATTATYTTNLTATTTLGVMVRQIPSECWATDRITINVNPIPVVTDIKVNFVHDTLPVCNGAEVTLTAAIDAYDAEGAFFTWFRNGELIEGVTGPVFSENVYTDNENVTTYHYSAIVTLPASGCESAMSADAGVVIVGNSPASVVVSGNTVICNGGETTLYANVVPAQDATYQWFMNNAPMTDSTNNNITVDEAGSYKVIAFFGGCSTESEAVVVTVEQTPQLEVTAVETTFCAGGNTVITAEATGWNNGNVNYNWSNGYQGSAYEFNPAFAGTYTFYVTASQATSGCVAVDSIVINVNELPETPVVIVDNAVVCGGGQVTLTVDNANNDAVYTWYRNGVVITGANNAILTESPVAIDGDLTNYNYTVVAELPMSGCTSLMSVGTPVTVIPTPVVAVSVEGNTTLCENGTTTLHANVTPAGDMYHYQWYKDNVLLEGDTLADYIVSEDARETAYNFSVVVSANPGCNVTAYAPAITFVAQPEVVATISNNFSCEGGTATLNAVVDGGVANVNGLNGYSFQWYRHYTSDPSDVIGITDAIATTPEFVTPATDAVGYYTYWVTVTSEYGCLSTSAPVSYTVMPDPVVVISRLADLPASVCNGGTTAIRADVLADAFAAERGAIVSYQWYKNGNILVGETNQILNINALAYGVDDVYSVEIIQSGVGCSNFGTAAISTLVTVNPAYTVNITGFGNVCEGGTLTLNAQVNGTIAGDSLSYQWFKIVNGYSTAINGATEAQYSTSDFLLGNSYDYYVVVTSTFSGCSVVSTSVPANVVAAPTVVIQGANTVCEGGALTLNAFVTGGVEGDAYTYTWEWTGGSNSGSATTNVSTFVPTVPANDAAAPYYFTVTISRADNTGCTATSAAHEVNVTPVPTVTVTADNNFVCQNGEVTFTAHVSPVGSYNYSWVINDHAEAVNANTITTSISNVGTITATVTVSAANASSSCSTTATIAAPVQVVAVPTVNISANHTTMCVGGTSTFTSVVNANGNIPSDFNYQWAINGIDVPGAVSSTFVQSFNAAAVYEVSLRVFQNNDLGCSANSSAPVTVQVAEQPVITLNSEDGLSICEGGSITMTGVVTNYGNTVNGVSNSSVYGALTFNWTSNGVNVPGGVTNNDRNQLTQTLNNVGNYSYQVTVDAAGYNCQPQASNVHVVNVVGDPSWTEVHVYSNNGTDACLGDMVTLAADIQGGVVDAHGSTSGHIQWVVTDASGNTTNVSGGLGGSSYDIPAVAGTYIYTPTFVGNIGNGCQLTNTTDVQVAVTVHELPTATFTSGDGASICSNDPSASAALVISFTGVAPFTYEVVDGHGNVVAHATTQANTATIYVAPTEQTTYRLTLIQDAYCENTAFDATAMATVYVNSIEFDNTVFESGCDNPGFVTINFNMISGNPTAAFTVVYDNGLQASGNISNNTATFAAPTVPGDYNAVFTVDGCSYDIVVRVLVGDFSFGGSLPIMDQRWNDVVVVNNNPATNGGHVFVSYQWYKNGVAIPGAVYSNYQEKGGLNGFYSVELIEQDANGNMVTYKTCDMYFSSTSTVKVYPVPANVRQEITLELDLTSEELEGAVLDIYSMTGAHVGHVIDLQPITKIEGFKAQGTYFGRILTGTNEIKTVKFVIVK